MQTDTWKQGGYPQRLNAILKRLSPHSKIHNRRITKKMLEDRISLYPSPTVIEPQSEIGSLRKRCHKIIYGSLDGDLTITETKRMVSIICDAISSIDSENRPSDFFRNLLEINYTEYDYHVGDVIVHNIIIVDNHVLKYDDCNFYYEHSPCSNDLMHNNLNECRDAIIEIADKKSAEMGSPFFDGPTVRLNKIIIKNESPTLETNKISIFLSKCQWSDWVVQQFCLENYDYRDQCKYIPEQIRKICFDDEINNTKKNFENVQTSNQLGTSIVIISSDGYVGIQRRSGGLDNIGFWGATVSENISRFYDEPVNDNGKIVSRFMMLNRTMDMRNKEEKQKFLYEAGDDFEPINPPNGFFCVLRGIYEELGHVINRISLDDIRLISIAFDRGYCVPHLYFLVEPQLTKGELNKVRLSDQSTDSWETDKIDWFKWDDVEQIRDAMFKREWARVSKGAVLRAIMLKWREEKGADDLDIANIFSLQCLK